MIDQQNYMCFIFIAVDFLFDLLEYDTVTRSLEQ